MGRTPDYMNVTYAGFAGRFDEWAVNGNDRGAENLVEVSEVAGRDDISLTHTIVHTTVDQAKGERRLVSMTPAPQGRGHRARDPGARLAHAGHTGALRRRARGLSRAAHAQRHRRARAVLQHSMDTPGLKFLCRDSTSVNTNRFDNPLSSRFDEQDAFVIFDDVEVPRDRIFIDGNLAVYNAVMLAAGAQHHAPDDDPGIDEAGIRLRLGGPHGGGGQRQFAAGAADARRDLELRGVRAIAVLSAEQGAYEYGNGGGSPTAGRSYALRAALPVWFPRVNEIIRLIGSHNISPHRAPPSSLIRRCGLCSTDICPASGRQRGGARRASFAWRGTSRAAPWPAATNSTSGSIWARPGATRRTDISIRIAPVRTVWSTASSTKRCRS